MELGGVQQGVLKQGGLSFDGGGGDPITGFDLGKGGARLRGWHVCLLQQVQPEPRVWESHATARVYCCMGTTAAAVPYPLARRKSMMWGSGRWMV